MREQSKGEGLALPELGATLVVWLFFYGLPKVCREPPWRSGKAWRYLLIE
jgi:hypothetical protein